LISRSWLFNNAAERSKPAGRVRLLAGRLDMNCEQFQNLFVDYLGGTVSDKTAALVEAHLSECVSCNDLVPIFVRDRRLWLRVENLIEPQIPRLEHPERPLSVELNKELGFSRPLQVFLSYSSEDLDAVEELHRKLKDEGVRPWLDNEVLVAGLEWEYEIEQALRNTDLVIVFLSRSAVRKRGYRRKEIQIALSLEKEKPRGVPFLIPLRLEECNVPRELQRFQRLDYYGKQGFEELRKSLRYAASKLTSSSV